MARLAVEEELGQGLGQLGLAHAGRARGRGTSRSAGSGPASPARLRLTALATAFTASSWPTIRRWIWSSSLTSLSRSVVSIFETGMPVHWLTTSAISSGSTSFFRSRRPSFGARLAEGLDLGDLRFQPLPLGVLLGEGLVFLLAGDLAPHLLLLDGVHRRA